MGLFIGEVNVCQSKAGTQTYPDKSSWEIDHSILSSVMKYIPSSLEGCTDPHLKTESSVDSHKCRGKLKSGFSSKLAEYYIDLDPPCLSYFLLDRK